MRCSSRTWFSSPCIPTHKAVCYSQCNCITFPIETSQRSYNLPANKAEPRQPVYILTISQSTLESVHHTPLRFPLCTAPARLPSVGTTPGNCVAQQQMRWEISAQRIEAEVCRVTQQLILHRVAQMLVSEILLHISQH